jgi:uncharacterized protein (TIGR03066 family)
MSCARGLFALLICAGLGWPARADDKKADPKDPPSVEKLLGVWEITKGEGAPPGTTVEFKKEGKLEINVDLNGKGLKIEGTYKLDGGKLTVSVKGPGGKDDTEIETIKTLTKDALVTVDDKGKETEFKRKAKAEKAK